MIDMIILVITIRTLSGFRDGWIGIEMFWKTFLQVFPRTTGGRGAESRLMNIWCPPI
jgi:hypothetical protein